MDPEKYLSSFQELVQEILPNPPTDLSTYGEGGIKTLLQHYGSELSAESIVDVEFAIPPFISSDNFKSR